MTQRRDQANYEALQVVFKNPLSADDTMILGSKEKIEEAKTKPNRVMGYFEEKTNELKEENVTLC